MIDMGVLLEFFSHSGKEPFSTDTLVFLDTIRVLTAAVCLYVAAFAVAIAKHVRNSRQYGCYSLTAYSLHAMFFVVLRLGDESVSPAMFLAIIGAVFGFRYCYRVTREIWAGKYPLPFFLGGPRHWDPHE